MSKDLDSKSITDKMRIQALKEENRELKRKMTEYEKTLEQYDFEGIEHVSDVEYICTEEIKKLRALSDARGLDEVEVKNLDTLHKNLRQVRGNKKENVKKKEEEKSVGDLLSIVQQDDGQKESKGQS